MNIKNARTEPFVGYYDFHEHLNITIKIMTASLNLTMNHVDDSLDKNELGNLIVNADPTWKSPPVWSFANLTKEQVYGYVSELGLVTVFSALDDFIDGVESEISRWNLKLDSGRKLEPMEKYHKSDEKVINIYRKYNWLIVTIDKYLPMLKYFRMARNCIVHRKSKASSALSEYSSSKELERIFNNDFKSNSINVLPRFEVNDKVVFDPKFAISSSIIFRSITADINNKLLSFLGEDGIINMAAHHGFFKEKPVQNDISKTPEAVFNYILVERYKVLVRDKKEAISKASNLGIWKKCLDQFPVKHQRETS